MWWHTFLSTPVFTSTRDTDNLRRQTYPSSFLFSAEDLVPDILMGVVATFTGTALFEP